VGQGGTGRSLRDSRILETTEIWMSEVWRLQLRVPSRGDGEGRAIYAAFRSVIGAGSAAAGRPLTERMCRSCWGNAISMPALRKAFSMATLSS
jgi:hypothetical protein